MVFNFVLWTSWNSTFVLNDGVQYLSTATNWLNGYGFSTNALMYTPHFQGVLPAPQTVWPLGYPLLIASVSTFGISIEAASLFTNMLSRALSGLLVMLILMRLKLSRNMSFFCAMIFYFTANPWAYSVALVSEPLFSMLILATIYFQPGFAQRSLWPWIFSGVLVALCVSIRYSGVLFAVGIGAGMFVHLLRTSYAEPSRLMRGCTALTVQLSIPVLLLAAMLYRTYTLTGTISRNIGVIDTGDLYSRMRLVFWQIREYVGYTDAGFLSQSVATVLFCIFLLTLILVLTLVGFVGLKKTDKMPSIDVSKYNVMLYLIVGHTAVFVIFFVVSVAGLSLVDLNHRYLYQIYPGLFILFCTLTAKALRKVELLNLVGFGSWTRKSIVALFCLFALAQLNLATALDVFAKPGVHSREILSLQMTENVDLDSMIQSCFGDSDKKVGSIWSNDGQQLYYTTGVPTITVADVYGNRPYDLDIVRDQIVVYDIKMFVILNNLPDIDPQYVNMLSNVKQWLGQQGYPKVEMLENGISNDITVEVYAVDKACL